MPSHVKITLWLACCAALCVAAQWLAVALAFSQQLVEAVPMDEHDRHVDVVVTAEQLLHCSERAARQGGA